VYLLDLRGTIAGDGTTGAGIRSGSIRPFGTRLHQTGVRRVVPELGHRVSGGRTVPALVALTVRASALTVPALVDLTALASDLNVPVPVDPSDQAPVALSGPVFARNVPALVDPSVLLFVRSVRPPVDPSGRPLGPNVQAQVNVREISSDRKLRGHDLTHDRNTGPVKAKERGRVSMPGRNRVRGRNTELVLSRVQGRSSGPVLSKVVRDLTKGAAASSGLGHKEVNHRSEVSASSAIFEAERVISSGCIGSSCAPPSHQ
jgi:hypothetical protein